jgi:SAM-dependent methyltransferase
MQFPQSLPRILAASGLAAVLAFNVALAQTKGASTPQPKAEKSEYQPTVGQEGKDVVWVPTPQALVERMLDMARVTKDDFVIDLGSGDGRTVITAAKRGVRAKGIEYNPDMVELSKRNAAKEGVADKVELVRGDIFESDFSDATVITLFLLPSLNQRLRPTILNMKPGTRVVSNTFDMGDWQADETIQATGDCTSYCRAYFWMVPAKAAGKWKTPSGELTLEQRYQILSGQLSSNNQHAQVYGKVIGDRIVFTAGRAVFDGKISGDTIEGTLDDSGNKTTLKMTR